MPQTKTKYYAARSYLCAEPDAAPNNSDFV